MITASNNKRKRDLLLITALLIIATLLYAGSRIIFSDPPLHVEISVDGNVVKTLQLNRDAEFTVDGYHGGTNHVVIKDGKVRVTKASCPDKLCIKQGAIHRTGDAIVCLPNRVIIRITG